MSALGVGLHPGVAMRDYLAIDAVGSSRLEWLAISPKHYRYMLEQPAEDTPALRLGTALHLAVLEPELFEKTYWPEPDPEKVAPGYAKPRATNAYREACAALESRGLVILKEDEWQRVNGMAGALRLHAPAARILSRAPEREVTGLWERDGRLCRGRFDVLGDDLVADLKTTRSLAQFNPWTITTRGYYRQMAHYVYGLRQLGRTVKAAFLIAVESTPPWDVGVFLLDEDLLNVGLMETNALLRKLAVCELSGDWPGMFPDIQQATVTEAAAMRAVDALEDETVE